MEMFVELIGRGGLLGSVVKAATFPTMIDRARKFKRYWMDAMMRVITSSSLARKIVSKEIDTERQR